MHADKNLSIDTILNFSLSLSLTLGLTKTLPFFAYQSQNGCVHVMDPAFKLRTNLDRHFSFSQKISHLVKVHIF